MKSLRENVSFGVSFEVGPVGVIGERCRLAGIFFLR